MYSSVGYSSSFNFIFNPYVCELVGVGSVCIVSCMLPSACKVVICSM